MSRSMAIVITFVSSICCHPVLAQDSPLIAFVQMDRLEFQDREDTWEWDLQGWVGGDENKFWWKTEGEFDSDVEELQLLYSHAISPYWDLQLGAIYANEAGDSHNAAVIGLQGLAPQWFEVGLAAFLTEDGELEARLEVEYDLLLTQRLMLQPRLELDSQDDGIEFGLRLRYEFHRKLTLYIGTTWHNDNATETGTSFVGGVSFWF